MFRKQPIWLELPLRRDVSNAALIQTFKRDYPVNRVDGIVLSDRAAGLPHFCEAEEIVQREFIPEFHQAFPQIQVINVCKTGDRCQTHLQALVEKLRLQGTSKLLLVSGHNYRTTLNHRSLSGERCSRMECGKEANILCGQTSRQLVRSFPNMRVGTVCSDPVLDLKEERGSFQVTQIAPPPAQTRDWLDKFRESITLTVMPMLTAQDLHRASKLGAQSWTPVANWSEHEGIAWAKETLDIARNHEKVNGVYIYSPSASAASELILHHCNS